MTTMYVLRKVLDKLEVKSFVSQQLDLLNMWKMKIRQPKKAIHSTLIAPPFISSCKQPKLNRYQKPMKDQKGDYIYEDRTHTESLPNLEFSESRGINTTSHPADWYNVLMPRSTRCQDKNGVTSIADFTSFTNKKAYLYNTGSGVTQYLEFEEFSVDEIMQHLGVYILNGLSPSPQVEMKFDS